MCRKFQTAGIDIVTAGTLTRTVVKAGHRFHVQPPLCSQYGCAGVFAGGGLLGLLQGHDPEPRPVSRLHMSLKLRSDKLIKKVMNISDTNMTMTCVCSSDQFDVLIPALLTISFSLLFLALTVGCSSRWD